MNTLNLHDHQAPEDRTLVRSLWLHERHKLEQHLLRLDKDDRYLRFGGFLSDDSIRRYCQKVEWWNSHLVGWVDAEGELRAVGEARVRREGWSRAADMAFSVEASHQGRGLGTELFGRLLIHARNRSVAKVYITSLPTNQKMKRIARRFGLTVRCHGSDDCDARIELQRPDYASLFSEAVDEGTAHVLASLRAQGRGRRPADRSPDVKLRA